MQVTYIPVILYCFTYQVKWEIKSKTLQLLLNCWIIFFCHEMASFIISSTILRRHLKKKGFCQVNDSQFSKYFLLTCRNTLHFIFPPPSSDTFCHPVHKTASTQKTWIKLKNLKDVYKFNFPPMVFNLFE